jgi:hypothetical protein
MPPLICRSSPLPVNAAASLAFRELILFLLHFQHVQRNSCLFRGILTRIATRSLLCLFLKRAIPLQGWDSAAA